MAFDDKNRNFLQKMVDSCRRLLSAEFTKQLQELYGIQPGTGSVIDLSEMTHLTDDQYSIASLLRDRIDHLASGTAGEKNPVGGAIDRVIREQAFTILNRFAALRMSEERAIVKECVRKGMQSQGFQVYLQIAGSSLGDTYQRYRVFLGCLFDELAIDLGTLFDRYSPFGLLFPREQALNELLLVINDPQLKDLWKEDETIGWIYQYFNTKDEREAMRKASQAPRNSRELAVRNQFFTPRYVVEFLTDNTLGRIWYEMTKGNTSLKDNCRYLVRRPNEVFLAEGEEVPADSTNDGDGTEKSQEELLKEPVHIPHRPIKDPRMIMMLDPACGSMHFGLYSFDLFETIYDEAWDIYPDLLSDIREQVSSKEDFMKLVPEMIIRHNIHGIDIDPRACQIAELSLWLRAQKSYQRLKIKAPERPRITKSNIVCAEPMPGEKEMLEEFIVKLKPAVLGDLVREVWDKMQLAGEAGSLLKIEEELTTAIEKAKEDWERYKAGDFDVDPVLFKEMEKPVQGRMRFDITGVKKKEFWDQAETLVLSALREFAESATNGHGYQRKLFAEDAVHGFAFIDLCRKRFDVVLMNPPFGDATPNALNLVRQSYPEYAENLYVAFHSRASQVLAEAGLVGVISSRTFLTYRDFERFRNKLLGTTPLKAFADLGWEVLDNAQVETAAYVTSRGWPSSEVFGPFFRLLTVPLDQKAEELLRSSQWNNVQQTYFKRSRLLQSLPGSPLCYWSSDKFISEVSDSTTLYPTCAYVGLGASPHSFFFRSWWEVDNTALGNRWKRICRGGDFSPFYRPNPLVIDWHCDGGSVKEYILMKYPYLKGNYGWKIQDEDKYGLPGLTWGKRNERFNVQAMPSGHIFTDEGQGIIPTELRDSAFLLGYMNSAFVAYFLTLTSGLQKHYVYIRPVPILKLAPESVRVIEVDTIAILGIKQKWDSTSELSPLFVLPAPAKIFDWSSLRDGVKEAQAAWLSDADAIGFLRKEINEMVFSGTSLTSDDVSEIQRLIATFPKDAPNIDGFVPSDDGTFSGFLSTVVSFMGGVAFGRWDIRFAIGEKSVPELPDPFASLPICPPGMLQNADGLPAEQNDVPSSYPIPISWSGILVDDENRPDDIINRVREVLEVLWKKRADTIEQEACEMLGVKSLRDYFRKPSGFFADHLKRYSKSRRQAPIYWPLSTKSGSYTLWIYYHRLNDQALYKCINDFVNPKIDDVSRGIEKLQSEIARGGNSKQKEELADQIDFMQELRDFRDEILRVTRLPYKPNLNDGVLITASPIHNLFNLPKWKKALEECWKKLEDGDYDWAHLAYTIWPDRVKEVCKKDRSIAIAHGLEDLCEIKAPEKKAKKKNSVEDKLTTGKWGKKKNAGDDALAKMGLEF